MFREKKPVVPIRPPAMPVVLPPDKPIEVQTMVEPIRPHLANPTDSAGSKLGGSLEIKGDLIGDEDLVISGQFEGTINVQGHCLTIGAGGKVKAEIQAARVVIHGSVQGNISVRERVEILKTGHVIGDLIAPGISIEDGAYFKGRIEILREGMAAEQPSLPDRSRKQAVPLTSQAAG